LFTVAENVAYPRIWSRWLKAGDEVTYLIAYTEGPYGQKSLIVEKLDPTVYGGDAYHDLGMCHKHFTDDEFCPLTWDECGWRHWLPDQIEERWVDPTWLAKKWEQGLKPTMAPDHPHVRYEGVRRYYADMTYLEISGEMFLENVEVADAQWPEDGRRGADAWRSSRVEELKRRDTGWR
jgi:hypothetical protein